MTEIQYFHVAARAAPRDLGEMARFFADLDAIYLHIAVAVILRESVENPDKPDATLLDAVERNVLENIPRPGIERVKSGSLWVDLVNFYHDYPIPQTFGAFYVALALPHRIVGFWPNIQRKYWESDTARRKAKTENLRARRELEDAESEVQSLTQRVGLSISPTPEEDGPPPEEGK
ncbi:hypothetical protein OHS81_21705 [Streptomyces sp. NBC_00400]|uniref:hypothetical protein n=1 Tax=Streptomyces sp. NBC_00400 TaxID=2975737 RepID=UPI002E202FBF